MKTAYILKTSKDWQKIWFSQGYTHIVCWHDGLQHKLNRFKSESFARIFADSINPER